MMSTTKVMRRKVIEVEMVELMACEYETLENIAIVVEKQRKKTICLRIRDWSSSLSNDVV